MSHSARQRACVIRRKADKATETRDWISCQSRSVRCPTVRAAVERTEDHVHRFSQIHTDGRAKPGQADWGEERRDPIRAPRLLVSRGPVVFSSSVPICENLWMSCFSPSAAWSRVSMCSGPPKGRRSEGIIALGERDVKGEIGEQGAGIVDATQAMRHRPVPRRPAATSVRAAATPCPCARRSTRPRRGRGPADRCASVSTGGGVRRSPARNG